MASAIATAVDYSVFFLLLPHLTPVRSNLISGAVGFLTNFTLQKKFVFHPTNSLPTSFFLASVFAAISISLGSAILFGLNHNEYLLSQPLLSKILVSAALMAFNYLSRCVAFGDPIFRKRSRIEDTIDFNRRSGTK